MFGGRPIGIVGASIGPFGTMLAQSAWLTVLRALGMRPWFGGALYVTNAARVFDESGEIIDQVTQDRLRRYLAGFVEFARAN